MANADISLLFGVLGEGSLSGESGSLIQSQLTQIMSELNRSPLKVRVALDTKDSGNRSWFSQLQSKLNKLSASDKFSIKVSKLSIGAGAISDFKRQLSSVLNTLHLESGTSITLTAENIGEITAKMKQAAAATQDAAQKVAAFKVQMEALSNQKSAVKKAVDAVSKTAATDEERAKVAELTTQYEQWAVKVEEVRASKEAAAPEYRAQLEAEGAAILANIEKINEERRAAEEAAAAKQRAEREKEEAEKAAAAAAENARQQAEQEMRDAAQMNNLYKQTADVLTRVQKAQRDWTAASTGRTSGEYQKLDGYIERLKQLQREFNNLSPAQIRERLSAINREFGQTSATIREAGENTKTFGQRVGGLAEKFGTWLSITRVIMGVVTAIRRMISTSIELDDAMTQLRIVTHTTEQAYKDYMNTISETATRIGSSITDLVEATTTYARLGYSIQESSALAEFTAMLQNVGNIDVSQAQDAITSIIKAFGKDVDEIESIMDKLVITGNNFPISVSQIAEGMTNASSALAAAGNTFEQSVALLTAANTTIQNAAKASTGLRTIAARLRNTTTELDELGESMTEATYEELVAALTKYNVALTDANGEFRSTYDILADIAKIWDSLTSMEQAGLATAISGTRQQAIFFSLIEQFQEASGAMEAMENSAGTLRESYDAFLESVTAHINQFKAAFQSLSSTTFTRDFLNGIIDFGTGLLGALEVIMKLIDAVGGLNTVLFTTVGIIATLKANSIFALLTKILAPLKAIIAMVNTARAAGVTMGQFLSNAFNQVAVSASTAQLAIGAFAAIIGAVMLVSNKIQQAEADLRAAQEAAYSAAIANAKEGQSVYEAYAAYLTAKSATDDNVESKKNLEEATLQLAEALGIEEAAAKGASEEIQTLTASELEKAYYNAADAVDQAEKKLVANMDTFKGSIQKEVLSMWGEYHGYDVISGSQAERAEALIGTYQALVDERNRLIAVGETETLGYKNIHSAIELVEGDIRDLLEARGLLTTSQERYNNVLNGTVELEESATAGRADAAKKESDALSDLSETLTALKSAYDLAASAEEEMTGGEGGISVDTIKELASAEKNYVDFLYEENGVVKLNTEAWKNNARAKMAGEMLDIQKEISEIEKENKLLLEQRNLFSGQRNIYAANGQIHAWETGLDSFNQKIEENNSEIQKNQALLALYGSLYSGITGEANAYVNALSNFSNIANTIDSVSGALSTLASLQEQVANTFSMSLDKALEFASVYPEILNNATVAADGQIALNEDVVNGFIEGKQAELGAQIDAEIAKLEADKATLTAKKAFAEAQLELAKNVGEGEGQIAKELAEYRINASNALTQALIENGVSEADAFALVAAAMAKDEEEFARVAMGAFKNMDENAAKAAYSMAQSILSNAQSSAKSIAGIAKQAHETAKAIAAMGRGEKDGIESALDVGGGGVGGGGVSLDLYHGNFNSANADFDVATVSLDNYVSQLELDISAYNDAIAQIDGQIAALQAIKAAPLSRFSGGGTSGGDKDSTLKEIEEYIADIDEYYKALKRLESIGLRLSQIQAGIDTADSDAERIALTKQLINVYEDEAEALENLNSLRSSTISNGVQELQELGFQVSYNAKTNEFYIENLEHLNELQADSQEATNALRQETEEFINTMEELNQANQDSADSMRQLQADTKAAKQAVIDYLKEIVTASNELVDSLQNVYDTLHTAADEYAANGYITIDTLQSIIGLGAKYMQYLMDENGLLVINHERIDAVLAAKSQELALNEALTYVERLRLAMEKDSIEDLNDLLYATTVATDATWGLVYANLALLGLDNDQYQAALHNINAIRALGESAAYGIGRAANEASDKLNNMKSGVDDILKYVMEMLKQRIKDQVDALEDMKDAYGELIDLREKALESVEKESDYQDNVAKKVREIANLQSRLNAISLDDSREAKAQQTKLEEELYELQTELADMQSDHAREAQEEALDDMKDAYIKEKDEEIGVLNDSISSYQKLYDMAIEYIGSHWDTLYQELIGWNTQYGSVLNSEITTAWDNCLAAAQRYGDYVSALRSVDTDVSAAGSSAHNDNLGNTNYDNSFSREEGIHAIIKEMYANSMEWGTANDTRRKWLSDRNLQLGTMLNGTYGIDAVRGEDGAWYVGSKNGSLLYDKYRQYIYHSGGIAGDVATPKQNEVMAILKKGEPVLDEQREKGLFALVDFATTISEKFDRLIASTGFGKIFSNRSAPTAGDIAPIGGGNVQNIQFGDVYIYGADGDTVEQHREINRRFTNDILEQLNIRR